MSRSGRRANPRRARSVGDSGSRMADIDTSNIDSSPTLDRSLTTDTAASPSSKLTRREQVALMREQKLMEEQSNYTFRPTVPSRRGRDPTVEASNVNRFDRLYSEAKARKEKVKAPEDRPTFTPTITALGHSKKRSSTPEGVSKVLHSTSGSGNRRTGSTPEPAPTFKPTISRRGKSLDRNRDVSPSTRLFSQAEITKQKLAKKAEEKLKNETKDCTFSPQTNKGGRSQTPTKEDSVDVTTRMQRYMLLKEKKLEQLRQAQQAEADQVATFKPATYTSNRRSLSRERNGENGDVFHRLHSHSQRKLSTENQGKVDEECTFRPTLVATRAVSPREGDENYLNAHERLYFQGKQRQLALEQEKEEIRKELEKDLTFTPQVTHRSNADESDKGPVFERLSASRQYVHEILSQIKSEFDLEECTFHPAINPTSENMARNSTGGPVYDRLNLEAEKTRIENEKRRLRLLEEQSQECTFTPQLSKAFNHHEHGGTNSTSKKGVFDRLAETPTATVPVRREHTHSPPPSVESTPPPVKRNIVMSGKKSKIPSMQTPTNSATPVASTKGEGGLRTLFPAASMESTASTVSENGVMRVPSDADLLSGLQDSETDANGVDTNGTPHHNDEVDVNGTPRDDGVDIKTEEISI